MVVAVRLRRAGFDEILRRAVHSSYVPDVYGDAATWREAVAGSDVRLQWDPDHGPGGEPLKRRAVQLGLRGDALAKYAGEWVMAIEDVTPIVLEQSARRAGGGLMTPREEVYPVSDPAVARKLGVDHVG